jgi:hypothetical protein
MDTITPGDELVFDVFAALAVTFPQADRPRGWPPPSPRPPRRPAVGDDPHKLDVARDMYASKQYTVATIAKDPRRQPRLDLSCPRKARWLTEQPPRPICGPERRYR